MTTLSAAQALARAQRPQNVLDRQPAGTGIPALRLNGQKISGRLDEALTSAELTRTITGASTLTLNVSDGDRRILTSGVLSAGAWLALDGLNFTLAAVSKAGDDLTLTFEDREVAWLRRYTEPRKAARGPKMTRAQFVLSLVREVREGRIGFYCPELKVQQPVKAGEPTGTPAEPQGTKGEQATARLGAGLTVKGKTADADQRANMRRVLDVAEELNAPEKARVALCAACIVESTFRNLTYGDSSSIGILQLLDIHLGGSTATKGGRRDVALVARLFLTKGFTGKGGAISLAQRNPGMTAGQIAQAVQGSAYPDRYDEVRAEAEAIVRAYGGGGLAGASSTGSGGGRPGVYEFTRGQGDGQRESSWDAIGRLADEVQWRRFMVAGVLWFISDDALIRQPPLARLRESTAGIDEIDFDFDTGQAAARATVRAQADRWAAPPGSVVLLERLGPANGRWIVEEIRSPLDSVQTEITLLRTRPKLPEPEAPTVTGDGTGSASDSGSTISLSSSGGGALPKYAGASSVSGGEGGDWGGAKPIADRLAALVCPPAVVSSTKRSRVKTASGNVSDHYIGNSTAYANDIACSLSLGDQIVGKLAAAVGVPDYKGGYWLNRDITEGGRRYRVQIGWRTEGHYDHIHCGVKRL